MDNRYLDIKDKLYKEVLNNIRYLVQEGYRDVEDLVDFLNLVQDDFEDV